MAQNNKNISLSSAAIIAGTGLLIMVIAAPFAEFYAFPKLVNPWNITETIRNITMNEALFRACIFSYLITFICDILVAWALYILLKPVNEHLSILTAWLRLVYSVIALVALINLINILKILSNSDYIKIFQPDQLGIQINTSLNAFKNGWYFGIIFFGIHLIILGYLVLKSIYIPKILGVLLIIAGLGYLANAIRPFLFPQIHLDFAKYTYYGELIFMLWLIIRGWKIKEPVNDTRE